MASLPSPQKLPPSSQQLQQPPPLPQQLGLGSGSQVSPLSNLQSESLQNDAPDKINGKWRKQDARVQRTKQTPLFLIHFFFLYLLLIKGRPRTMNTQQQPRTNNQDQELTLAQDCH